MVGLSPGPHPPNYHIGQPVLTEGQLLGTRSAPSTTVITIAATTPDKSVPATANELGRWTG
jgi:hypothetical protein